MLYQQVVSVIVLAMALGSALAGLLVLAALAAERRDATKRGGNAYPAWRVDAAAAAAVFVAVAVVLVVWGKALGAI